MNCPQCGFPNPDQASQCQRCGAPLLQQPIPQTFVRPRLPKPVSDTGYFIIGMLLFLEVVVFNLARLGISYHLYFFRAVVDILLLTAVWVMLIVFARRPVFRILNIVFGSLCFLSYVWEIIYRNF